MKTNLLVSSLFSLFIGTSVNAQWIQQTSGTVALLNGIHCVSATNCMVAGATTSVRKTTDGTTWTQVTGSTGITNKVNVKMYSKDTVMLLQDNGTFKRSTNGGSSWSSDIFGGNTNFDLYDIAFISNLNFTAVGGSPSNHVTGGHITTSSINTGAAFPTFINVSGEPTFFGIHALSTTTFVACGGGASVYKTIDGGANWTAKLSGTPTTTTLYDINFPTPLIGYAAGGSSSAPTTGGVVYKTTDGGETWASASTGLLGNTIFGIHFVNQDTGYVVGDGGKIQVTENGGASWTTQISPVTTTLNKIYFPTSKTGYICGASGVIIKTTTGGFIAPLVVNSGADVSVCNGVCATLGGTPTVSGGTLPYTYAWSSPGGTTSSLVVCPSVTTTYTLTVADANSVEVKDSVKVTVFTYPAISISGLNNPYCNLTSSDTLAGVPAGGVFSGAGIGTSGEFNAAVAGAGTHTITYTYNDVATGCSISDITTATVLPMPTPVQLCLVTVDSNITNTTNILTWVKPVVTNIDSFGVYRKISGALTKIATLAYSAESKYVDNSTGADPTIMGHSYAITTFDTCGIESALSDTNTTMWIDKPAFNNPARFDLTWTDYDGFTFTVYEIWRTLDGGANYTLVGSVPYAAPTNTYTDNNVPNLHARYRIRTSYPAGCNTGVSTYAYSLSNVTLDYYSVNELSLNNWLQVYPNPNHGTFTVKLSGAGYEVTGMKVYNMLGEVVYQSSEKNKTAEIHIPGITPGIYQLEVTTDSGTANKKITIE